MVTCEICGGEREFTPQGLFGHKRWVHGIYDQSPNPSSHAPPADQTGGKGVNQFTPLSQAEKPVALGQEVLTFLRARGRRRMETCSHLKKGELTGKPICWFWGFHDEDDDGGLELVRVKGEEHMRAVANPLLCGACEATDAFNPKKRVEESESRQ